MAAQLSLFDALYTPPVLRPVDPDGAVIIGPVDVTLRLPHPRLAWDLAGIQLHEHVDGTWMWSVQGAGGSYCVGPKWGRFAGTQQEAQHHAARELLARVARITDPCSKGITRVQLREIVSWAEALL